VVDLTNLQRQIAHTTSRIGQPKVNSAEQALKALNPEVTISALAQRLNASLLDEIVPNTQVVLDCCDNFETRQAINAACVKHRVPLISGAAIGLDGQLAVYDSRNAQSPCYACIFPPDTPPAEIRCATMGVLAPLVGVMGSLQALEAIKILSGMPSRFVGKLQMLDARSLEWIEIGLSRNPKCPVCGDWAH
jgi:molybdopterin-synthase adenylyltransferase